MCHVLNELDGSTELTLTAVNCVYKTHLSESVQERDQKKLLDLSVAKEKFIVNSTFKLKRVL
jgi:hypothetical protein